MKTKEELMRMVATGRCREAFTFVEEGTGAVRQYDITLLRHLIQRGDPRIVRITVPLDQVVGFILTNRVWEEARVAGLTDDQYLNDPAIALVEGEGDSTTHCIADGAHRIIRRHRENLTEVDLWCVPEEMAPRVGDEWGSLPGHDWGAPLSSLLGVAKNQV